MKPAEEEILDHLDQAYDIWLMEYCSDEIHTRDQLIEAAERGHRIDDFHKFLRVKWRD